MADQFKLPGSSYEELVKIIRAYSAGKVGQAMSLDTVAQAASMDKTIISRNNGFLVQCGLITEGNQKAVTDLGNQLARAYNLKMDEEVRRLWRICIEADEFLTRMLSAVRIRDTMEKSAFLNHIVYSSGATTTKYAKTGASTLVELFLLSGFIEERDGQITALDENAIPVQEDNSASAIPSNDIVHQIAHVPVSSGSSNSISININIDIEVTASELDILPQKIKEIIAQLENR